MQDIIARMLAAQALNGVKEALSDISTLAKVFDFKGTKDSVADLPQTGNKIGDVWSVHGVEYVWRKNPETGEEEWYCLGDIINLEEYLMKADVVNETGEAEDKVMSQKAVTEWINKLLKLIETAESSGGRILSISVDGEELAIDENRNVDIPLATKSKYGLVKLGKEFKTNDTDGTLELEDDSVSIDKLLFDKGIIINGTDLEIDDNTLVVP